VIAAEDKITIFLLQGCRFCRASLADRTRTRERYIYQPGNCRTLEWRQPYTGRTGERQYRWWVIDSISQEVLHEIPWDLTVINAMKQSTFNNFMAYIHR
jgi:hypothetical protein